MLMPARSGLELKERLTVTIRFIFGHGTKARTVKAKCIPNVTEILISSSCSWPFSSKRDPYSCCIHCMMESIERPGHDS